nr:hypothetical protein [Tanacetum cinerariifolium]
MQEGNVGKKPSSSTPDLNIGTVVMINIIDSPTTGLNNMGLILSGLTSYAKLVTGKRLSGLAVWRFYPPRQGLSLSTLRFLKLLENKLESMKILKNKLESLKLLENKLESMMILENKLESLKLQENQLLDGLECFKILVINFKKSLSYFNHPIENPSEITALHIDGQSIDVDAPPDIIDVVDEDDDNIDEEDPITHDFTDSDDEDLINIDIDDEMSADVAQGHGGDGGGDDHPLSYQGTRKPNLGGRRAGRLHTLQKTWNLELKAITDKSGPVLIRFEVDD